MKINQIHESHQQCPECGGLAFSDLLLAEKKDACYSKVRSRYKVWPSAYASGALVQCRKKGAANWGNKSKNEDVAEAGQNFRRGNARRAALNAMSPEELKAYEEKRAEQQRKRDEARLERERQRNAAKKGVAEATGTLARARDRLGLNAVPLQRSTDNWNDERDARHQSRLSDIERRTRYQDELDKISLDRERHRLARMQKDDDEWNDTFNAMRDRIRHRSNYEFGRENDPRSEQGMAEASSPAQQAAIAVSMKKAGNKPMNEYNAEYDDEAGMADNNLETLQRAVKGIDDLIDAGDNLPEWCQEKIANAKSMLVAVWDYMYSEEASDEVDPEVDAMFEAMDRLVQAMAKKNGVSEDLVWEQFEAMPDTVLWETAQYHLRQLNEDWQKVNKQDKTDGMSRKAVKAYRRENPGSKLKTAVTTKPSKLKKGGKAAKRRKSFCARMRGMKKSRASAKTKRNPNSPINKALRRWNC